MAFEIWAIFYLVYKFYILYIRDLDKVNLIWWFDFRPKPNFDTALAATKYYLIQKWSKVTSK